ncbi:MAG: M12 family metallo-peptidase, partial [Planctomycetota bacterium]
PPEDGIRFNSGIGTSDFVAELGIDVDPDYVARTGGLEDAVDEVSTFLNNVNEGYERDLGITHVVTVLILHTNPASNPYTSTIGSRFNLDQVNYWTNDPTVQAIGWDLVLTMTGKDTCSSAGGGCDLLGRANQLAVVCNRNSAFCYAEYVSNDSDQAILVAHELGHLWSGTHCATGSFGCNGTTPCLTMCNFVGGCDNGGNVAFGPCNINSIMAHRNSRTCLDGGTTTVGYVRWRPCGVFCSEAGDLGAPHNTLREAVDDAVAGGTIIINSGTSSEADGDETFPLRINKAVTLRKIGGSLGARAGT